MWCRSVLRVALHPDVEPGSILLNATHLVNNKVCTGEKYKWTVYQGENFTYDAREGAIGDTALRSRGHRIPLLSSIVVALRRRQGRSEGDISCGAADSLVVDASSVSRVLSKKLYMSILTVDDVCLAISAETDLVCRVSEVCVEPDTSMDEEAQVSDEYRGLFDASTRVYIIPENQMQGLEVINSSPVPRDRRRADEVNIVTSDEETFPVLRRLLRPCIALTSVVQSGRGKYKASSDQKSKLSEESTTDNEPDLVPIAVDACTFDRVLLYLEHSARGFSPMPVFTFKILQLWCFI